MGFTSRLIGVYSNTFTNIESYMILYNDGGAYNGTVFTCPSPGLYLFQVSVITFSVNNGIRMYKNFQQLTFAFSGVSPQANGASVSAATWLEIGDEVYLRPHNSSLDVDFNSVFTGVKIIWNFSIVSHRSEKVICLSFFYWYVNKALNFSCFYFLFFFLCLSKVVD